VEKDKQMSRPIMQAADKQHNTGYLIMVKSERASQNEDLIQTDITI